MICRDTDNADSKSRAQDWKQKLLRWHGIAVCFEASSSSFPAIRVTACSTALASVQGSMRSLSTGPRCCNVLSTLLSRWPAFHHPLLPATVFVGCFGALPTSNALLESIGVIVKMETGWNQNRRNMIFLALTTLSAKEMSDCA